MLSVNTRLLLFPLLLCGIGGMWPKTNHPIRMPETVQEQSKGATLRTTTHLIVLDVVVTDEKGNSVDNLRKEDFSLLEDDQEQTAATFEESGSSPKTAERLDPAPAQNILLFDEINTQFKDLAYARYCVSKLLRRNRGELESLTSLLALTNEGLVILHEPTRDGEALLSILNRRTPTLAMLLLMGGVDNEMERINISLGALHEIAAAGAGSNIRRNIIWISPGFPLVSSLYVTVRAQDRLFEAIGRLSSELLHARMTVYTVDPRGVPSSDGSLVVSGAVSSQGFGQYVQMLADRGSLNFPDLALQRFTQETGGKSFWGRNDLDAEVARSMADGSHYYTISYYPTNLSFDGKFRKISAKVNRPGLKARTRAGYFAIPDSPPPTKDQLTNELEEALGNPVAYTGIHIGATANIVPGAPEVQRIFLRLDRHDLTCDQSPNNSQECALVVATASFSTKARPLKIRTHNFTVSAGSHMASQPVTLSLTVPVDSQAARLRVLVRDGASGRMGSVDLSFSPTSIGVAKP